MSSESNALSEAISLRMSETLYPIAVITSIADDMKTLLILTGIRIYYMDVFFPITFREFVYYSLIISKNFQNWRIGFHDTVKKYANTI